MALVNQAFNAPTLGVIVGRVRAAKPNIAPTLVQNFCNSRIADILNRQPRWSGLIKETLLYVPAYTTGGSVALTQNSTTVTGTGTSWSATSAVNTTIPAGVQRPGVQLVTPASMTGITTDTYLYLDASGTPEIVNVLEITPTSFKANFQYTHSSSCTATSSTLCGQQLRLGNTYPIFTVVAVVSSTSLIVDMPWLASAASGLDYQIWKMFYTISPDAKAIISVLDQAQGIPPLEVDVPIERINAIDPQRSSTGYPQKLANKGVNQNGNNQWELWPRCPTERQLRVTYAAQQQELTSAGDRIPPFIDPSVLYYGCMADASMVRVGPDDQLYDPKLAQFYEQKFEEGVNQMIISDNERNQTSYHNDGMNLGAGGANWAKDHLVFIDGNYW